MVEPTDYSRSSIGFQSKSDLSIQTFNWNEIFYLNKTDDYKK